MTDPAPAAHPARRLAWQVVWCVVGLALCGVAVWAVVTMIARAPAEPTGFAAFTTVASGVSVGLLLASGGLALLGVGIAGTGGGVPEPARESLDPAARPEDRSRERRLHLRTALHRTACVMFGVGLMTLGPHLMADGPTEGSHQSRTRQRSGPVGAGLLMMLVGLATAWFGVTFLGRPSTTPAPVAVAPAAAPVETTPGTGTTSPSDGGHPGRSQTATLSP